MKRIVNLLIMLALSVGISQAQVVIENEQKQNKENLPQQEQQDVIRQQQEKEMLEQQKEQERLEKERVKAEKEAAKAEKEAKAAAKRQRREEIGRGSRIGIAPYAYLSSATRSSEYSDLYNSSSIEGLGLDLTYHYPLNKKIDLVMGLGYRINYTRYTNVVEPNNDHSDLVFKDISGHFDYKSTFTANTIMVPIHLNFVGKKGKEVFLGVDAGYTFKTTFAGAQLNSDNKYIEDFSITDMKNYKKMRLDFVLGFTTDNILFFSPGIEVFFNILPTYIDGTNNNNPIHEFGVKIQL